MDILQKLRPEDELILFCARIKTNDITKDRIKSLLKADLDWDYIIYMVTKHKLTQLFYKQLTFLHFDSVPSDVKSFLITCFNQNTKKNLFMYSELLRIISLFNKDSIMAVPYKGPLLAILAYDNLALRDFGDLDIYIQKEDVLKAKKILEYEGYTPYLTLDPSFEEKFLSSQVDYQFLNNKKSIVLELHWHTLSLFFSSPTPDYNIYEFEESTFTNGTIMNFSPESLIIILCIHNSSHYWSRLLWLCDIKEFIESHNINWETVMEKSEKLGAKKIVLINLYLANILLNLKIPKNLLNAFDSNYEVKGISEKIIEDIFVNGDNFRSLFKRAYMNLKIRDSLFLGIKDIIKGATTPTVYEWNLIPSVVIYPICYLFRPIMLLKRYGIR